VSGPALLSVEGVVVDPPTARGNLRAVDHVDLKLGGGRTLGIVGESGCGKTMLSRAILQLLPKKASLSGRVVFDGQDLVQLDGQSLRKLRARSIAVVFQDPRTSLNPVLTIGTQLIETLQEHLELHAIAARKRSEELLAAVGIPAPTQRLNQYPHQLSGGMRQRVGDSNCVVLRAEIADLRRADDRVGRHHSGADPQPPGAGAAAPPHGDDPDHP
jgi:peptide/nickel transport system ATP-binding protein